MSDYFERVEARLLDAVEREAAPRRPAGRMTVAAATVVALLVAVAATVALVATRGATRDATVAAGPLAAQLEVLRRPQQPGDAPAAVLGAARRTAATAAAPFRGTVDPAATRRLTTISAVGYRVYIAPLSARAGEDPDGVDAALVVLTGSDDVPLQAPYGLTSQLLRGSAFYVSYGLRALGRDRRDMRSLLVQVVPDGVARVDYTFSDGLSMLVGRPVAVRAAASGNAAVVIQRGRLADSAPLALTLHDASGRQLGDPVHPPTVSDPIAPRLVCRGVEVPPGPTITPVIRTTRMTVADLCRQAGLPLRAVRRSGDRLLLLYPEATLIGTGADGTIGMLTHVDPGARFPPALPEFLPAARPLRPTRLIR